jgi:competence protein ComEC
VTGGLPAPGDPPPAPPDLRLAGLATACWLTALAGLHLPATVMLVVAGVAATLAACTAAVLLVGSHRRPDGPRPGAGPAHRWPIPLDRWGWIVVAVLLGIVCGGATVAARLVVRDARPVAGLVSERARVSAELVVRDDPRAVTGGARPPTWLVRAELVWLRGPAPDARRVRTPARILVLATDPGWRPLLPGQRVRTAGRLSAPRGGDLTSAVLSATAPVPVGPPPWAQRAAGVLRTGLQRACAPLPDDVGGLLPGLVVGDTSRLLPAVQDDFRVTGMTHLNAVSGSNVAVVVGLVLLLARWSRVGPWPAAVLSGLALLGFVVLARPSPSVLRAAVMGAIGLLALGLGRPRAAVPALGCAVTVLVVADPELAGDPGFALSVLATAGLLLVAPGWRDGLRRRGVPAGVAEALAVPAAAQLACTPVVAALSGTVSVVAVPANLLAVPAVAPATVLGVAGAVLSPVSPTASGFLVWLASWPARWLVAVAHQGAALPAGTLPWPGGAVGGLLLGGLTVGLLVAGRRRPVRRLVAVVTVAAVLGALPVRLVATGWPPPGWLIVACDVGQGDALVLAAGAGAAVVVDAGPEPAAVDRCLRRLDVRTVRLLLVSHFHADHVGGVAGVFQGRRVEAVATTAESGPAAGEQLLRDTATAARAPVTAVPPGWRRTVGPLLVEVLGPPRPLHGTRSDANNNSLVLRVTVDGVRILLAGDAEGEEQRALLDTALPGGLRADVLKVAHHGSAYQEPAFLDAVHPSVALVSVGRDNDYGHPSVPVLDRLTRGGARVLRTDVGGDLAAVRVGGGGLAVAARGPEPGSRR